MWRIYIVYMYGTLKEQVTDIIVKKANTAMCAYNLRIRGWRYEDHEGA